MENNYTYKEQYNKWEKFINGGNDLSHLRREVAKSWKNCRDLNVNPFKKPYLMSEDSIINLVKENQYLIDVVSPFIKLITEITKETNFMFVLCDNKGNVVDIRGNKEILEQAKKSKLEIGANRSEIAGTNAISLAISMGKPYQLVGPEHYNVHYHQWTCSSAPIYDLNGKLIGVINLSGHYSEKHTHTLGMVVSLARAIEKDLLYKEKFVRKPKVTRSLFTFDDLIGKSDSIQSAINTAQVVSKTDTRIIIEGESGTGKEMFVQAIHNASARSNGPFVAVNCGAVPEHLVESELFGYDDGAFTGAKKGGKPGKFELANSGTLFLDEINSMSKDMQVKLLRVLQQNEITRVGGMDPIPIDVRVIAASNEPLESLVEQDKFRKDLFYRLGIVTIEIPPLRIRTEDVPELFHHLFTKISNRLDMKNSEFNQNIFTYLKSYHWPGNIRELENYIERAIVLAQGKVITIEHFPKKVAEQILLHNNEELTTLEYVEKESIKKALNVFDGNISKTSKLLGITRKTLYKKIKDYNLQYDNIV
ncbi:sigma-54-dependent Fis family transcriptional regulator [Bacillus massiliigorillae]|uniref:sigma-54-dependent Fis family transcriptional regulator n=1 Tax=Bacillus massiliigorillae TaxID=1243664 RepID=UPI00039C1511|nr:sigma-54-dependent Fis family transcriptional regulator [Bacillus massiliigorillae]